MGKRTRSKMWAWQSTAGIEYPPGKACRHSPGSCRRIFAARNLAFGRHRTAALCATLPRSIEPLPPMALARPQDTPLVDSHAHVYRTDMPQTATAWHHPPADATIEDYLATLDAAGVSFGVIAAASLYGDYNDYTLEAVRRHKRLRATVIVRPDADLYMLRKMKDDGIVGIRFQFRNVASPPDLTSSEYRRLLRRVADLDWHVHLHDNGARLPAFIDAIEAAGPR